MLMIVVLYALFDRKLREFGALHLSKNDQTMRRELMANVRSSGSMLEKYPQDFDLYRMGEMETETGKIMQTDCLLVDNLVDVLSDTRQLSLGDDERVLGGVHG